jgi:hypothetical protein
VAVALAALSCGAVFLAPPAPTQAQQEAKAPQPPPTRTLNCLGVAQAIYEQRKSVGSEEYRKSLLKFYDEFPAKAPTRKPNWKRRISWPT